LDSAIIIKARAFEMRTGLALFVDIALHKKSSALPGNSCLIIYKTHRRREIMIVAFRILHYRESSE